MQSNKDCQLRDNCAAVLENTLAAVQRAATNLRAAFSRPVLRPLAESCPDLASAVTEAVLQIHAPFKVAVSGEVSAGKSSFVNAFLGQDLALVDTKECTAVCSEFEFGYPEKLEKPLQVIYRDGRNVWERLSFRNLLKGTNAETLDLAESVDRLVFQVSSNSLDNMVLVDTPGLNSVVEEHETIACGALGAIDSETKKLRLANRNDAETREIASAADAVLWLVSEDVLERTFEHLSSFLKGTIQGDSGSLSSVHSFNVIVVLTKADERKTKIDRLRVQEDVSRQLNDLLPCEVRCFSVSSAVERTLQKLGEKGIEKLRAILQQDYGSISSAKAELFFKMDRYSEGLITQRMTPELLEVPKGAFIQIAMMLLESESLETALAELEDLSGFNVLRKAIAEHFAARATALKGRVVVAKCKNVLHKLSQEGIERTRQRVLERRKVIAGFTWYVASHPDYRTPDAPDYQSHKIGEALRDWLASHTLQDTSYEALREIGAFQETFDDLQRQFERTWIRLDGLAALEDLGVEDGSGLSYDDRMELRRLFSTSSNEKCPELNPQDRAMFWGRMAKSFCSENKLICELAEIAANVYREWCAEEEE